MLIVESYKHIGELTCGGKAKYFARCVFAVLCACLPCVYIFIRMFSFLHAARYAYSSVA